MVVTSFSSPPPIFFFPGDDPQLSSSNGSFAIPSSFLVKGLRRHQDAKLVGNRARGGVVRVLANPNVSPPPPPGKAKVKKEVIMVDPLEAKRLAGKQMEEIRGREKQQRRREIEAINGAWGNHWTHDRACDRSPNGEGYSGSVGWLLVCGCASIHSISIDSIILNKTFIWFYSTLYRDQN